MIEHYLTLTLTSPLPIHFTHLYDSFQFQFQFLQVITGTFVASSGMILSAIMCIAMNRNLMAVLAGGFGEGSSGGQMKKVEGIITEVMTPEIAET